MSKAHVTNLKWVYSWRTRKSKDSRGHYQRGHSQKCQDIPDRGNVQGLPQEINQFAQGYRPNIQNADNPEFCVSYERDLNASEECSHGRHENF